MITISLDLSVFDELKGRFSAMDTKAILKDAANAVYVEMTERVHVRGVSSDGSKIGDYTAAYMKVRTGKGYGNIETVTRGKNKGLPKKDNSGVYTKGAKKGQPRIRYNRTNQTPVVLSLTREMENDMKVFETNEGYVIGFSNSHNYDKAIWNGKRYGKKIWALSEEEENAVRNIVSNKIKELINE